MNRLTSLLIVFGAGALSAGVISYWIHSEKQTEAVAAFQDQETRDLAKVEQLLQDNRSDEARHFITAYKDRIESQSPTAPQWLKLLIKANDDLGDAPQLTLLYEYKPEAFNTHEHAAVLVGDYALKTGQESLWQRLRHEWEGRETLVSQWFILDADNLLSQGEKARSIQLLKSRQFDDKEDVARLLRLALLTTDQPDTAWTYISQALEKDPQNPVLMLYRAKILEMMGHDIPARYTYLIASQTHPSNPYLLDQLANFYLRHNDFNSAFGAWKQGLQASALDTTWIDALFWNRIVAPLQIDWATLQPPKGPLAPYIQYLLKLKPNEFWNDQAFALIPASSKYLHIQQSTYWLRLLQALKQGEEAKALAILDDPTFQLISWAPDLEMALRKTIQYRKTGSIQQDVQPPLSNTPKADEGFFKVLRALSFNEHGQKTPIPQDIAALLKSPEAYSAACLAQGWMAAALALHTPDVLPPEFPDWVAVQYTRAISQNQSQAQALAFAKKQKPSTPLSLVIGELYASQGEYSSALDNLTNLALIPSDIGLQASHLISLIYINQDKLVKAKKAINQQLLLKDSLTGKETLARIAALQGKVKLAISLYEAIEDQSFEAKSFLALKAFQEKDWDRAQNLTEQLILENPSDTTLQENLQKIIEAKQGY